MQENLIRLALIGFHGAAQASLEMYFNRQPNRYELVDPCLADGTIYNADRPLPLDQQREQYRINFGKPGVVISINPVEWPGMIAVTKPYSTETLEKALKSLRELLTTGNSGALEEIKPDQNELENVLRDYRAQLQRGDQFIGQATKEKQERSDRRKNFQEQFLARKRAADSILERLKAGGTTNDLYQEGQSAATQTTAAEQDLLKATADVVTGSLELEGSAIPATSVPELKLTPATAQEIDDCCGSSPDFNLNVPIQRRRIFFNPEGQLLSLAVAAIQRAHNENSPVAVFGLPNHQLIYHPETGKFYADVDNEFLVQMAQVRFRFGELRLQLRSPKRVDMLLLEPNLVVYPAEQLIWRLACWSSRGRLIGGIDLDSAYQLDRCPDKSMLIGLPRTADIIQAWLVEPMTAEQLMARLDVSQRYLFPFMTAAWVLGWLRKQPSQPADQSPTA